MALCLNTIFFFTGLLFGLVVSNNIKQEHMYNNEQLGNHLVEKSECVCDCRSLMDKVCPRQKNIICPAPAPVICPDVQDADDICPSYCEDVLKFRFKDTECDAIPTKIMDFILTLNFTEILDLGKICPEYCINGQKCKVDHIADLMTGTICDKKNSHHHTCTKQVKVLYSTISCLVECYNSNTKHDEEFCSNMCITVRETRVASVNPTMLDAAYMMFSSACLLLALIIKRVPWLGHLSNFFGNIYIRTTWFLMRFFGYYGGHFNEL
nr:TPA_asm: hypothetical protein [Arceuthobium sichuanense virus 3]